MQISTSNRPSPFLASYPLSTKGARNIMTRGCVLFIRAYRARTDGTREKSGPSKLLAEIKIDNLSLPETGTKFAYLHKGAGQK